MLLIVLRRTSIEEKSQKCVFVFRFTFLIVSFGRPFEECGLNGVQYSRCHTLGVITIWCDIHYAFYKILSTFRLDSSAKDCLLFAQSLGLDVQLFRYSALIWTRSSLLINRTSTEINQDVDESAEGQRKGGERSWQASFWVHSEERG